MTSAALLTSVVATSDVQRAAVNAADELFTLHGITPVTLPEIAAHAQVDATILRRAYPEKRDLVVAVLAFKHQQWFAEMDRIGRTHDDPRDEILAVFTYLEECFTEPSWRGCVFITGYGDVSRQEPDIAHLAGQHLDAVEQHIGVLCARAGIPSHIAETLNLLIQGAQTESAIHHTVQPARAARSGAAMLMSIYQSEHSPLDFF
ncbi:TetR/AcrR family transcriptional regulator [Frondihabitans sp. VKM Ac-2883]|uniref:TetR/AcrR family transcriptional regulator n=1 Tax=Frondihabitans sp. VKM Ac-2883 TaxID=2783823 RepID=UPI00188C20FD|nr:TetR/AcrR family transcriptional regulator [Frondihabitans sp. VKM Ac-2883]MBF4577923.1 TetR/AcrR family transcriptional regulator [Frondihabitans sp. VKM Ac-2883]